jgi:hypothetical protein
MRRFVIVFGLTGLFVYFALLIILPLFLYYGDLNASIRTDLILVDVFGALLIGIAFGIFGIIWNIKRPKDYWVVGIYWIPNITNGCLQVILQIMGRSASIWHHFFHK